MGLGLDVVSTPVNWSMSRWRSPLGSQTPVCFGKLFLEDIIPVQGLVGLPESTSSRATAWQTDLHEGGREGGWGAGEEVGVLVLSFAPRLPLCIASLHPHGDVLAAGAPPLARHLDQLQNKANQGKSRQGKQFQDGHSHTTHLSRISGVLLAIFTPPSAKLPAHPS